MRDLVDGQDVDSVFVVRDRARRQKKNGEDFLKLQLGDVTGAIEAVAWDSVEDIWTAAVPGSRRARQRPPRRGPALRRDPHPPGGPAGRPVRVRPRRPARRADGVLRRHGGRPALAGRHRPRPGPGRAARARLRRGLRDLGALAPGAGRQVLPPGLPPRADGAQPLRGPGRERPGGDLPGHQPRRRRHRRAAPRHRQDRGLRHGGQHHRDDRPGQAPGRDPAGLLPRAPRDRGDPGLLARDRRGRAPHHPVAPRQARARQPGAALHPRGHARAHDRQPRRHPRELRPHREEPAAGRALVELRPRISAARPTSPAQRHDAPSLPAARAPLASRSL